MAATRTMRARATIGCTTTKMEHSSWAWVTVPSLLLILVAELALTLVPRSWRNASNFRLLGRNLFVATIAAAGTELVARHRGGLVFSLLPLALALFWLGLCISPIVAILRSRAPTR